MKRLICFSMACSILFNFVAEATYTLVEEFTTEQVTLESDMYKMFESDIEGLFSQPTDLVIEYKAPNEDSEELDEATVVVEGEEVEEPLDLTGATDVDVSAFVTALDSNLGSLATSMTASQDGNNYALQLAHLSNAYQNLYFISNIMLVNTEVEQVGLSGYVSRLNEYVGEIASNVGPLEETDSEETEENSADANAQAIGTYIKTVDFDLLKILLVESDDIYTQIADETHRLLISRDGSSDEGQLMSNLYDLLEEIFNSSASYKKSTGEYDYETIIKANPSLSVTANAINVMLENFEKNTESIDGLVSLSGTVTKTTDFSLVNPDYGNILGSTTNNFVWEQIQKAIESAEIFVRDSVKGFLEFTQTYEFSDVEAATDAKAEADLETQYIIESLATVKRREDAYDRNFDLNSWECATGDTYELTSAYIAMLAATAVHTPFVSTTNSRDYMEALAFLAGENSEEVLLLYDKIKDFKKPLYDFNYTKDSVVDQSSTHYIMNKGSYAPSYSGTATRTTLASFQSYVNNSTSRVFVTVQGEFILGEDMNTYAFYKAHNDSTVLNDGDDKFYGNIIAAGDTVSTSFYSPVIFSMGEEAGNPNLGLMLMTNIFQSLRNTNSLQTQLNAVLYVDVLGNIVMADGTIILPAAANPIFYDANGGYNPYTVAMQNNYPTFIADSITTVGFGEQENGKLFYQMNSESANMLVSIIGGAIVGGVALVATAVFTPISLTIGGVMLIMSGSVGAVQIGVNSYKLSAQREGLIEGNSLRVNRTLSGSTKGATTGLFSSATKSADGVNMFPYFYSGDDGTLTTFTLLSKKGDTADTSWFADNVTSHFGNDDRENSILHFSDIFTPAGNPVFPYIVTDTQLAIDTDYYAAKMIAQNMYWFYTFDGEGKISNASTGSLLYGYLFENFIVEGLQGSKMVASFEKDILVSNVILMEEASSFDKTLRSAAYSLYDTFADEQGVLGILDADTNPVFGKILQFFDTYSLYIYLIVLAIFIFRFTANGDLLYTTVMSVLACVVIYVFIYVLPAWLPMVYNSVSNFTSSSMVSEILLYNAERYSTTYSNAANAGLTQDYDTKTTSITLYRMSSKQLDAFVEQYGIDKEDFRYGELVVIDSDIGLYLQGDSLKINLDVFMYNNPVYGEYTTEELSGTVRYQLQNEKMTSSAFEYYSTFYLLEDGFIDTLNSLVGGFSVPRRVTTYLDGFVKDSFVVYAYMKSAPFLYPDDYSEISGLDYVTQILKYEELFPEAKDFLKIGEWVHEPTTEMMQSLWYMTMRNNGFYDPVFGEQRRSDLIDYVNYQTKLYMIRYLAGTETVSDENLVKSISLQAMFAFNTRVSEMGSVLYPIGYNVEDLTLQDVLLTTFTDDSDRFISHQFDLVAYMYDDYGAFGLLLFVFLLSFAAIIVLSMNFSFPFIYTLLSINILWRIMTGKATAPAIRGAIKTLGLIMCIYSVMLLGLVNLRVYFSGITLLVVFITLLLALICFLFVVTKGFVKDLFNLGDKGIPVELVSNPLTRGIARPVINRFNTMTTGDSYGYSNDPSYIDNDYDDYVDYEDGGDLYVEDSIDTQRYVLGQYDDYESEFDLSDELGDE